MEVKKIPELARGLGKGMREIKNATNDIQQEIREGAREVNNAKDFTNVEKQVKDFIKDEKEQKKPAQEDEHIEPEEPTAPGIKPVSHPGSIHRKSPYSTEETEEKEES